MRRQYILVFTKETVVFKLVFQGKSRNALKHAQGNHRDPYGVPWGRKIGKETAARQPFGLCQNRQPKTRLLGSLGKGSLPKPSEAFGKPWGGAPSPGGPRQMAVNLRPKILWMRLSSTGSCTRGILLIVIWLGCDFCWL